MNSLLSSWYVRAGIVAGITWAAWKYLPLGPVGKTVALAVGGVAAASIVAGNVPLIGNALAGRLPLPMPTTTAPAAAQ
jgi:hypothetical protein